MIELNQKKLLGEGEKGLLQFHITVHHQRTSRQELKQKRCGGGETLLNGLIFMAWPACFA